MCQFVHRVSRQRGAALHFVLTLVTLSEGTGSTALGRRCWTSWAAGRWWLTDRQVDTELARRHPTELWPDWHAGTTSLGSLQLALPPICSRIMASENNRKIGAPLRFDLPQLKTDCSALSPKVKDSRPCPDHSIDIKRKDGGMKSFLNAIFKRANMSFNRHFQRRKAILSQILMNTSKLSIQELSFLRIQLKLSTALLSTVRVSVRHRRDISHFSHI